MGQPVDSTPATPWNGPGDRSGPPAPSSAPGASSAGPSGAGPAGAGPATGGPYNPRPRGPSTLAELRIQWDHPVPPKPEGGGERTSSVQRRALSVEEALAILRGNDPRPLLVLRECARCSGTEDALLSRLEDNERTFLMSRWFHCVKLPPAVIEPDHPFHNLFPGEKPAHLFVSRADGTLRHDLSGAQSQGELWSAMRALLAAEYRDDPERALARLAKILDRFDELDERILRLQRSIDQAAEARGRDAKELAKLQLELTELCARRNELREEVARASALARLEPGPGAKKAG